MPLPLPKITVTIHSIFLLYAVLAELNAVTQTLAANTL
jgi:hypothetical protein